MSDLVITITIFGDQSVKIDHPPVLTAETVVSALDRASNYYKMQMQANMIIDLLRREKQNAQFQRMVQ